VAEGDDLLNVARRSSQGGCPVSSNKPFHGLAVLTASLLNLLYALCRPVHCHRCAKWCQSTAEDEQSTPLALPPFSSPSLPPKPKKNTLTILPAFVLLSVHRGLQKLRSFQALLRQGGDAD